MIETRRSCKADAAGDAEKSAAGPFRKDPSRVIRTPIFMHLRCDQGKR